MAQNKAEKNIVVFFMSSSKYKENLESNKQLINDGMESDGWHQTNEAGVYYLHKKLKASGYNGLDKIFLMRSKDANNEKRLETGELKFTKSPYEYFVEDLSSKLAAEGDDSWSNMFDEDMSIIPYNDDKDMELESSLTDIFQLVDKVRYYALQQEPGTKIKVHVDVTGGLRHVAGMMISAVQLMVNTRAGTDIVLEPGMYVYTDFSGHNVIHVVDATELYNAVNFISGVQEFVTFGSPVQMENYFTKYMKQYGKNLSEEENRMLRTTIDLIRTMKNFYKYIHVCRVRSIQDNVVTLRENYQKWQDVYNEKYGNRPCPIIPVKLFNRIKNFTMLEYGELLEGQELDIFKIIRWCLAKGHLQQALTLCTELTLVIIIRNGLCQVRPERYEEAQSGFTKQKYSNTFIAEKDRAWRDTVFYKYFFNDYIGEYYKNIYIGKTKKHRLDAFYAVFDAECEEKALIVIDLLEKYSVIRDDRNTVNHADLSTTDIPKDIVLQRHMEDYLDAWQQLL